MKIFSRLLFFASFVFYSSCNQKDGHERFENTPVANDSNVQSSAFLIQGANAKVFLDTSSELRCDALKEFFGAFAMQALDNGRLENFDCKDMSSDVDAYIVSAQLTATDKTSIVQQVILGNSVTEPDYCVMPFSDAKELTCRPGQIYYRVDDLSLQPGVIDSRLLQLKDFVSKYINQTQSKDLSFGIATTDYARAWTEKFNNSGLLTIGESSTFKIWLALTPDEDDDLNGILQIKDIESSDLQNGRSIFGCQNKECLLGKDYVYNFNGHHLVINKKSNTDKLQISIPLTQL